MIPKACFTKANVMTALKWKHYLLFIQRVQLLCASSLHFWHFLTGKDTTKTRFPIRVYFISIVTRADAYGTTVTN